MRLRIVHCFEISAMFHSKLSCRIGNIGKFLTLTKATANIKSSPAFLPQSRPRRLAWPRTSPFHGGNTGSNPVGDANKTKDLLEWGHFAMGLKGFDNRKSLLESMFSRQFLSRQQNHFHQLRLCSTLG